jgi:retinol dehydrogenase-12
VTGASSGVGKELTRLLYTTNATIYMAARTESKCKSAIKDIISQYPDSKGHLRYLNIDLQDLESVRVAAEAFSKKEERLDALWNNAGVMFPPAGSVTKQGYELQLGTNTIAPFLLVKLLTPLMARTAMRAEPGSVRVLWVASSAAELLWMSPTGGVDLDNLDGKKTLSTVANYAASKGGLALLNQEYAKRHRPDGIVSVVSLSTSVCRRSRKM